MIDIYIYPKICGIDTSSSTRRRRSRRKSRRRRGRRGIYYGWCEPIVRLFFWLCFSPFQLVPDRKREEIGREILGIKIKTWGMKIEALG